MNMVSARSQIAWVPSAYGSIPNEAVRGGSDVNGSPLYIGRVKHRGDVLPGKISPQYRRAYASCHGVEIEKSEYEVLCSGNVAWQFCQRNCEIPRNVVAGGFNRAGDTLFIGRALYHGTLTPGRIEPSSGALFISFGGQEIRREEYEILIQI